MKILIAMDSFKGSLTSLQAGEAIKEGIRNAIPDAEICIRPLADGGEGTVEALVSGMDGTLEHLQATGPLGAPVPCTYGIIKDSKKDGKTTAGTAVMEMSSAAGLTLIDAKERNPLHTTTYGVGEIIKDAIGKGCRRFLVGIGGSATNDGGAGMLQALGFGLLDKNGKQIPFGAKGLKELESVTAASVIPELKECSFRIACDVTNPLCGPQGCSAVFGPQKGATPAMISQMDGWLAHFSAPTMKLYPHADAAKAGTGAAGGLGFAFLSYTNAVLESGIRIILEETGLEDAVKTADIVITGEGRLDGQTIFGKAPIGVAQLAKKHNKKVLAFSGCVTEDAGICNAHGIDAFFPILRSVQSLPDAMQPEHAGQNLRAAAEQVFRLIRCIRGQ